MIIPLQYPIEGLDKKTITQVNFNERVKVGDMMYVAENAPKETLESYYLIARMTGLDILEVQKLDLLDFLSIKAALELGKAPAPASSQSA